MEENPQWWSAITGDDLARVHRLIPLQVDRTNETWVSRVVSGTQCLPGLMDHWGRNSPTRYRIANTSSKHWPQAFAKDAICERVAGSAVPVVKAVGTVRMRGPLRTQPAIWDRDHECRREVVKSHPKIDFESDVVEWPNEMAFLGGLISHSAYQVLNGPVLKGGLWLKRMDWFSGLLFADPLNIRQDFWV